MPPVQCPNCGRFLKKAFVASLADAPAPCPACETELTPAVFGTAAAPASSSAGADGTPLSPTERGERELHGGEADHAAERAAADDDAEHTQQHPDGDARSVRPPDLVPDDVRDDDVLRGWDVGAPSPSQTWQEDRPPFPVDTVVVAGAGVAGLLLGLAVGRERRAASAAAGAAAGVVSAAVARRLWRLDA